MKAILVCLLIALAPGVSGAFAQTTVAPPPPAHPIAPPPAPAHPIPGTHIDAPDVPHVRFKNGASVWAYRDHFTIMDRDRNSKDLTRPLPDRARPPWGCDSLKRWLDTNDCHTLEWRDKLVVYLVRCLNMK